MRKEVAIVGTIIANVRVLTKARSKRHKVECLSCHRIYTCSRGQLLWLRRKCDIERNHTRFGCQKCSRKQVDKARASSFPVLTDRQMEIIVGSLLGDAYLSKSDRNGNSYFRKGQRARVRDYQEWLYEELAPYSLDLFDGHNISRNGKQLAHCLCYTKQHPIFTELRKKWYPKGKKKVPADIKLSPLSVAVWFMDDGCNDPKTKRAVLCTMGFTTKDCKILLAELVRLGVTDCAIRYVGDKKQPRISIRRSSHVALMDMITPHVMSIKSMLYKIDQTRYFGRDGIKVESDEHLQQLKDEARRRQSESMTGRVRTPEHRTNLSKALKNYYRNCRRH